MTEQDFLRQVWRPYDTVTLDGGMKGRVTSVCFPTRSVKVTLSKEVHDWFKCDQIEEHQTVKGLPDDDAIIEDLHNKLMAANKRNEDLQGIVNVQNDKIKDLNLKLQGKPEDASLKKLRKSIKSIDSTMGSIDNRLKQIDEYLTDLGITDENE